MSKEFYSTKQMDVYHNNPTCEEGNNIEVRYKAFGDGGLKLCKKCAKRSNSEAPKRKAQKKSITQKKVTSKK